MGSMTLRRVLMVLYLTFSPLNAYASVFISEIAWMGTDVSATNEWIELYNDADQPVALDGWTLHAKDGSPSIMLSGTIAPQGYYLIERTDDETVPDLPADLVTTFGKGISNEGETLELRDGSSILIDTVKSGTDWKSVGGDTKTKYTAQKRGSVWVTAKATPRGAPFIPVVNPIPPPPPKIEMVTLPVAPLQVQQGAQTSDVAEDQRTPTSTHGVLPAPPPLVKIYGEEKTKEAEKNIPQEATLPLLGTLILLGSSAVLYIRQRTKTEAERYEIIEDETDE